MALGSGSTTKIKSDSDPLTNGVAISLASDTDLSANPSLIYVGGDGTVKVDVLGGATGLEYVGFKAGSHLPVVVTKVYSTANGTTATDLIANW